MHSKLIELSNNSMHCTTHDSLLGPSNISMPALAIRHINIKIDFTHVIRNLKHFWIQKHTKDHCINIYTYAIQWHFVLFISIRNYLVTTSYNLFKRMNKFSGDLERIRSFIIWQTCRRVYSMKTFLQWPGLVFVSLVSVN